MLSKLLKYEIKATAREFLPLYGALLILSVIIRIFVSIDAPPLGMGNADGLTVAISLMVYFALLVAVFVVTYIVMIQRFYKNLLSDEGYLMFTLPVKTWQLIASKLLVTMMWGLASIMVTGATILVMAFNTEIIRLIPELWEDLQYALTQYFGMNMSLAILQIAATMILSAARGVLLIYASISIGHLFQKHRVAAAFGAFLGINVITSIIGDITGNIVSSQYAAFGLPSSPQNVFATIQWITIPGLIISVLFIAAYFFITNYVLSKHLNLE